LSNVLSATRTHWYSVSRNAFQGELEGRGITTPAAIGGALGIPAVEAIKWLT